MTNTYPHQELSFEDLSEDWGWQTAPGQDEDLIGIECQRLSKASFRNCHRGRIMRHSETPAPTLGEKLLAKPLNVPEALGFFNRVAFCYLVETTKRCWTTRNNGMVGTSVWLAELCDVCTSVCSQDVLDDNRKALAHVYLETPLSARMEHWMIPDSSSFVNEVRETHRINTDLQDLLEGYRQLCDLVQQRTDGPVHR